ncbi:hypothetical protein KXS07_11415 [Inquilinus limosus]|uniref:hypothetical protein n=1 Tax=Inquilinus limosus TaxID=171674 RepID=UPI003F189522
MRWILPPSCALLDTADADQDLARTKLAIDKFVDPAIDADATLAEIDRMTATIEKMIATLPPEAAASSLERMKALRAFLYEPGWWNDQRPFTYDLNDPYGTKFGTRSCPPTCRRERATASPCRSCSSCWGIGSA